MIRQSDINLILILSKLFNGHNELIHKIIYFKKDLELNTIKDEIIEINFYNWLNHDLYIRSSSIIDPYYQDYYLNNKINLGLIVDYDFGFRRIKSLNDCFQSKWWMTTAKNNFEWKKLHSFIKIIPNIVISKSKFFMDIENNEVIRWVSPKINELNNIHNFIGNEILFNDLSSKSDTYYLINDHLVNIS